MLQPCTVKGCHGVTTVILTDSGWKYVCPVCRREIPADISDPADEADRQASLAWAHLKSAHFQTAEEMFGKAAEASGNPDRRMGYRLWAVMAGVGMEYVREVLYERDEARRRDLYTPVFSRFPMPDTTASFDLLREEMLRQPDNRAASILRQAEDLHTEITEKLADPICAYDVFIAWHDGSEDHRVIHFSETLQDQLNRKRRSTFLSINSLQDVTVSHYEANIYAALHSCRAMIIVSDEGDPLEERFLGKEIRRFLLRRMENRNLFLCVCSMGRGMIRIPASLQELTGLQLHQTEDSEEDARMIAKEVIAAVPYKAAVSVRQAPAANGKTEQPDPGRQEQQESSGPPEPAPSSAPAAEPVPQPGEEQTFGMFRYRILPDGGAILTGYTGKQGEVEIPAQLNGTAVKAIGPETFAGSAQLARIHIPDGVESIGELAFANCAALNGADLPEKLIRLGNGAFSGCRRLTGIRLPASVRIVGDIAFSGCNHLTDVSFSGAPDSIGSQAFRGCALSRAELPEGVRELGDRVFEGCTRLTRITLPTSLEKIGQSLFAGCPAALTASAESGSYAESWLQANGIPCRSAFEFRERQDQTLEVIRYTGQSDRITVPARYQGKRVTSVAEKCFFRNNSLKEVTLAEGILSIGFWAFSGCQHLEAAHLPETLNKLGGYAFSGCVSLKEIHLPGSIAHIGANAFENCRAMENAELAEGIRSVNQAAFQKCLSLKRVSFPSTLRTIGMNAFSGCAALESAEIREGLTELDPEAFQGCTALQSANLPSTLTTIGSAVFEGCSPRLVCRTVSGSAADRWCRSQRISTQPCRPDSSAASAQEPRGGGRVCPYCGGRISLISGVCKRCGK